MHTRVLKWILPAAIIGITSSASADAVSDFYKGKNIQFIIHTSPGGSYDQYGRLTAKHIAARIPGNPNIIVQNMPGGGGLRAVNYLANVAPKDGTTLSIISQGLPMFQAMGEDGAGGAKLEADFTKFNWLGNLSNSNQVMSTWFTSPVKTIEDARHHEAILGAAGRGSISVQLPMLVNTFVGTKFKLVIGYPGSNEINLAMERGEVSGRAAVPWSTYKTIMRNWVDEKKLNFVMQVGLERDPELPNVPLLSELISDPLDKQAAQVITDTSVFGRSVATTPSTPQDRVSALREAMFSMMSDPQFISEAGKQMMDIGYMSGQDVDALVKRIVFAPKPVLKRMVEAMEPPKDVKDLGSGQ